MQFNQTMCNKVIRDKVRKEMKLWNHWKVYSLSNGKTR